MKKRISFMVISLLLINVAHADQIITGVRETTSYIQEIGLAICALGGVIGGVLMAFNNDSGAAWIGKALVAISAIGAIPFAVSAIGGFFNIG